MRSKYKKIHDVKLSLTVKEQELIKRSRTIKNDILAEKIVLEKVRQEETDEITRLRRIEDERDHVHKDLETVEQRDTMAKFELSELKRNHENLKQALVNMHDENFSMVEPVLISLKEQVFYVYFTFF